jgi:sulfate transport system permease protein
VLVDWILMCDYALSYIVIVLYDFARIVKICTLHKACKAIKVCKAMGLPPVVAGLALVLIFGRQGLLGPTLAWLDWKVIFAWPGLVLATTFVTLPLVVRELVPVLEATGSDEELAAVTLGANGWQVFTRVTLPNIRWALLHGIVLANARALGEFGAVYVVSGHIAGATDTMPLRVEKLFQEYRTPASMAVASVLAGLALVSLVAKFVIERRLAAEHRELEAARAVGEAT